MTDSTEERGITGCFYLPVGYESEDATCQACDRELICPDCDNEEARGFKAMRAALEDLIAGKDESELEEAREALAEGR